MSYAISLYTGDNFISYLYRLYTTLIEDLNDMLSTSIHSFEAAETALCDIKLSDDFDTATEQMDGAKV